MGWIKSGGPGHLSTRDFEVQRANQFEVSFTFPALLKADATELTMMVESFPLPKFSNEPIELSYGNRKVKVAGVASWENGDLVVRDAINKDTETLLRRWQKLVYEPKTDAIGWADDYKGTVNVHEYSPDGTTKTRTWTLIGVWPSSINFGDLGYDTNEKKVISATLSYDYAYREDEES